jgi:probable HAF family extracellular repeat protein
VKRVLLFLIALAGASLGLAQRFEATDLVPGGSMKVFAGAMNNVRTIAGVNREAFFYMKGGVLTYTGHMATEVTGVNGLSHVVGTSRLRSIPAYQRAFIFDGEKMTLLGTLGGHLSSAHGINASGIVVGAALLKGDTATHAVLWQNGVIRDLGTLGGRNSIAYAINVDGHIVGSSELDPDPSKGSSIFMYAGGKMRSLGVSGRPHAINKDDRIVGITSSPTGGFRAFLYDHGSLTLFPTLGGAAGWATDINAAGQIVGTAQRANGNYKAVIYEHGKALDLNFVTAGLNGWVLTKAVAIDRGGRILAIGRRDGLQHSFLLQPATLTP